MHHTQQQMSGKKTDLAANISHRAPLSGFLSGYRAGIDVSFCLSAEYMSYFSSFFSLGSSFYVLIIVSDACISSFSSSFCVLYVVYFFFLMSFSSFPPPISRPAYVFCSFFFIFSELFLFFFPDIHNFVGSTRIIKDRAGGPIFNNSRSDPTIKDRYAILGDLRLVIVNISRWEILTITRYVYSITNNLAA